MLGLNLQYASHITLNLASKDYKTHTYKIWSFYKINRTKVIFFSDFQLGSNGPRLCPSFKQTEKHSHFK